MKIVFLLVVPIYCGVQAAPASTSQSVPRQIDTTSMDVRELDPPKFSEPFSLKVSMFNDNMNIKAIDPRIMEAHLYPREPRRSGRQQRYQGQQNRYQNRIPQKTQQHWNNENQVEKATPQTGNFNELPFASGRLSRAERRALNRNSKAPPANSFHQVKKETPQTDNLKNFNELPFAYSKLSRSERRALNRNSKAPPANNFHIQPPSFEELSKDPGRLSRAERRTLNRNSKAPPANSFHNQPSSFEELPSRLSRAERRTLNRNSKAPPANSFHNQPPSFDNSPTAERSEDAALDTPLPPAPTSETPKTSWTSKFSGHFNKFVEGIGNLQEHPAIRAVQSAQNIYYQTVQPITSMLPNFSGGSSYSGGSSNSDSDQ